MGNSFPRVCAPPGIVKANAMVSIKKKKGRVETGFKLRTTCFVTMINYY